MQLDQVKKGQHVEVAQHQVRLSHWVGTTEHPETKTIKKYRGTVEQVYHPARDSGGVEILRDGTQSREEVDPEILTLIK